MGFPCKPKQYLNVKKHISSCSSFLSRKAEAGHRRCEQFSLSVTMKCVTDTGQSSRSPSGEHLCLHGVIPMMPASQRVLTDCRYNAWMHGFGGQSKVLVRCT